LQVIDTRGLWSKKKNSYLLDGAREQARVFIQKDLLRPPEKYSWSQTPQKKAVDF
jgi:hypothetical protein